MNSFFHRLGKGVARHPLAIIAIWVIAVVGLRLFAPAWDEVTHDGDTGQLPTTMTSVRAQARLEEAFPQERSQSECVVVIESAGEPLRLDRPRTPAQEASAVAISRLNAELRQKFAGHEFVIAYWPPIDALAQEEEVFAEHLRAPDEKSVAILMKLNRDFSAVALAPFVESVQETVAQVAADADFSAARLKVAVTGSAAIGSDMLLSAKESLRRTEWVTIALVLLILLAVYRAPVLVVIPLLTIGASVVAATDILAITARFSQEHGAGWFDFKIFTTTRIFIVVILVGAGTDFCLFLFARFREELRQGHDLETATARALGAVGSALLGSALTTIVGLGMLFFSEFGKFRSSGPALGACMCVALLASVTLAPAILRLAGKWVFWPWGLGTASPLDESSATRTTGRFGRIWKLVGAQIVARPATVLIVTVLVLLPLAWAGASVETTFDLVNELDSQRQSVIGAGMLERHFPPGESSPITIVATLPDSLDLSKSSSPGIAALRNMTIFLTAQPGVQRVRGYATPLGEPVARFGPFAGTQLMAARRKTLDHYVAPLDGTPNRVTRFEVIGNYPPFSDESRELLSRLRKALAAVARGETVTLPKAVDAETESADGDQPREQTRTITPLPNWEQKWKGVEFEFAGATATTSDLKEVVGRDTVRIKFLSAIAVLAVLLVLLRRPLVCVFLILSVVFSFLVTIGATQLVFEAVYGDTFFGLDWKVPVFLFVILVAIGEDYNIYLVTRVFEEQSRLGPMAGLREAVARTGGIISSCGIIMAGTFVSMMSGTLRGMLELGFALSLGVLLDTFIVRPVLVPAFLALIERFRQRGRFKGLGAKK